MDIKAHIEHAVRLLGSQAKLAAAIGCSQQQISYLLRAKAITAEMAAAIDRATNGQVARGDLRPDIFGHTNTFVGVVARDQVASSKHSKKTGSAA